MPRARHYGGGSATIQRVGRNSVIITRLEFEELRELARHGQITLLFGARDEAHKDAIVLPDVLLKS